MESKEAIVARIGRSPDRGAAAVYALCDEAVIQRATRGGGPGFTVERDYDIHRWPRRDRYD